MMQKRKKFEDLTIIDDFMFGAVMSNPERCKRLLEAILNVKIQKVTYPERQKVIDVAYNSKSVRLDVYVEDEKDTVYNIEMQTSQKDDFPLRIRYYHDMIDLNIIEKGDDYALLKRSFVIFFCTFDPFGKGLYRYTFDRQCREDSSLYLNDKATSIILNCSGRTGNASTELKELLHYMSGEEPKGALATDVAKGVSEVLKNENWRRDYMTLAMKFKEERRIADLTRVVSAIKELKSEMPLDRISKVFHLQTDELNTIISKIDADPNRPDEDIAEEILGYDG